MKVVVIDYQLGNINSIVNMLKKMGVEATISNTEHDILTADKLILPGVGAFDHGMQNLHNAGLIDILTEAVLHKQIPILGICLGMQLLLEESEEGHCKGLGWIKGQCVRFNSPNKAIKVPHMGWNQVISAQSNYSLADETRFYFVHSYHAVCTEPQHVLATAHHGYAFPAIIGKAHILGSQFHPEKSHLFGMHFLQKFIESTSC
ncbi:MAG: imidazole glycerol phosphate synthase subunit HisH [Gammaproteobacteria bacterium]|nr:imidazole glycerol phosphate synthase subunit HisH [Gammaproteobacteria bacterium]